MPPTCSYTAFHIIIQVVFKNQSFGFSVITFSTYKKLLSELTQLEEVFSFRLTAFLFLTASWLTQITSSWTTTFKNKSSTYKISLYINISLFVLSGKSKYHLPSVEIPMVMQMK